MLNEVPSGWECHKLGDHVEFQNGFAFKPSDWKSHGVPIVRIQNLNGGNAFNYYDGDVPHKFGIKDGDLLFCWSGSRGTSFGPRIWRGPFAWLNQHIFRCDPASTINQDFLNFLLLHMTVGIEAEAHGGAGLAHIKKTELVKFDFYLPPPAEQQRIAEILTSVDDTIRVTEAVIAQTERVKLGVMEDLLTGGLGSEAIANGEVPDGWEFCLLGDLSSKKGMQTGPFGSQLKANEYVDNGPISVVMPKEIVGGIIHFDRCAKIDETKAEQLTKHFLQAGDLLFARRGDLSKIAMFEGKDGQAICGTGCLRCRPNLDQVDPRFLAKILALQSSIEWLETNAVGQTMLNLNTSIISDLPLAIPPKNEQQRVVDALDSIEAEIVTSNALLAQTKRLKQGLMSDLLTGKKAGDMMKGKGAEWKLAEKPTMQYLQTLGYEFVDPSQHDALRASPNLTLFKPHLVDAFIRLNNISQSDAEAAFSELQSKDDNEEWLSILRGAFARTVEGQRTQQTLRVIDFQNPSNNRFHVTHQLYVKAEKSRIPDVVVYVNGIPLVVIEAKSPLSGKDKNGEAFDQIKQYERDIPRLFATNAFNIVTDGVSILYGATGAPSKFYGYWRDAWPRTDAFPNELEKGLWCLLEPSRLLDFIAHFIVFEADAESGNTIKKMCRYQQYRAVNKMVQRVVDGEHNKGLVWHTQGSGKSLTMVFAALKLKNHLTVSSPRLANPNLMVLTDRIDLDDQISATFQACGLANPTRVSSIHKLRTELDAGVDGKTLLSTIYKFEGSKRPIPNSANWIVMVDECHRTQEKDLGAYLRATMPDATFFGFTGTPVKKTDRDTYSNFSVGDERYLDKYGIDDAVRDGATVPIYYTGRKTDWHIDETKLDMMFDTWFRHLDEKELAQVKKRGVHVADLVKHPQRIDLIAFDLWNHFRAYAKPDGFKAQIVAYDREAIILYKRALDAEITKFLRKQGMDAEEAAHEASAMTACVFSKSQEDDKPTEDIHEASIRKDLQRWYLDRDAEKEVKRAFSRRGENPQFLIVCDKLLTGFDAPAESVMYLDKPLKEHSLLQAIARTNRVSDAKKNVV